MIVRILGEGQLDVPDAALDTLNELDTALQGAVDANDESGLIEMQVLIENPKNDVLGSRCQLITPGPST